MVFVQTNPEGRGHSEIWPLVKLVDMSHREVRLNKIEAPDDFSKHGLYTL